MNDRERSSNTRAARAVKCDFPTQLERPFSIIAFDWDGTAVMSRHEDATLVRNRIDRLLQLGVYIVVITGTNFQNVDRQLSSAISGPEKQRLFVCTNRGSEVYGFDEHSHPKLLWRRDATPDEDRLLTEIAEAVERHVEQRTGLEIGVVYNRLNRRKVDLIPLPEWADPPKSAIGDLLQAVEGRLRSGGIAGGLREVFELTERLAADMGLPQARVTSDVKHIEIGLTDKGDSIVWMMRELAARHHIPPSEILIGGDEFGPIGGFEGSDYKMVVPETHGAVYVSVGAEPNGVPPEVLHLGGGPNCFRALLDEQIRLHERASTPTKRSSTVSQPRTIAAVAPNRIVRATLRQPTRPTRSIGAPETWQLVAAGFEPAREHEIESLLTVANGFVGTRGSLQEGSALSRPGTFVAGVFDKPNPSLADLVVAPDWAKFRIFVGGEELRLDRGEVLEHWRRLDLRRGVFERRWRHCDTFGRITRLDFVRFASLADRHALVEWVTLTPENYTEPVWVDSIVDGEVTSASGEDYLDEIERIRITGPDGNEFPLLIARTSGSDIEIAFAAASQLRGKRIRSAERSIREDEASIAERWAWEAKIGLQYRVDKLVSVYTSRNEADPGRRAIEHLDQLVDAGADALLEAHVKAWAQRWDTADIRIVGDEESQRAVRFAMYHLISSANPNDERISVAARALTGEAYKGHVFWDTEIYMLPFYIFTHPPSARALLMYRYHTLPAARRKARACGYRGALYPWESANSGEEASPTFALSPTGVVVPILTGQLEHHISADVAYAVWQYWRATGDDRFFLDAGAEIVLETARFWASRVTREADGRYHILNVIGPDEYHEGVDDDVYTNGMAQWNLERGVETVEILRNRWPERWSALAERLNLDDEEPRAWRDIAQNMYTGFDPATGLFEQFRGYFELEYVDLKTFEPRTAPMDVILGAERTARSQVIKQPDVLMLIYLLWDRFSPEVREANFDYYEPRCGHGSSLSPSIHALLAARLGKVGLAERYFRQSREIDLANNMGNAAGGIHAAAQGGLWQAVVFGFAGMQMEEGGLTFDPHLPNCWQTLSFPVQWRGRQLRVTAWPKPARLEVLLDRGEPMEVTLGADGQLRTRLEPGKPYRHRLTSRTRRAETAVP